MRIGIDMRMAGTGEGISRYIEELVLHLAKIDFVNDYYLLFSNAAASSKLKVENLKFRNVIVRSNYYSFFEQTVFIWELLRLKLDLVHFPNFNMPIFYPGKFIITIHDLIHHQFPGRKKSRLLHRIAYRLVIWAAAKRAHKIIAVSEASKQDIALALKIDPQKIVVVYEGAEFAISGANAEDVLSRHAIRKHFILFVGVWRQYKNLPRLAQAFDIIREKYRISAQLVLVGKIDRFYPEIREAIYRSRNAGDIKELGYVPDQELTALYQTAAVSVLPSLTEGFGLTSLEAQALGAPVAASRIPVLQEILGEGAIYFDPYNTENMAACIARLMQDEGLRENLLEKGRANARRFSWQSTATATVNLYNS